MQTTRRDRLMGMNSNESAHAVATVIKCGACIGFLALLTVIGFSTGSREVVNPITTTAGRESTSAKVGVRAEAHRKQVFDERRARLEGVAQAQVAIKPEGREALDVAAP